MLSSSTSLLKFPYNSTTTLTVSSRDHLSGKSFTNLFQVRQPLCSYTVPQINSIHHSGSHPSRLENDISSRRSTAQHARWAEPYSVPQLWVSLLLATYAAYISFQKNHRFTDRVLTGDSARSVVGMLCRCLLTYREGVISLDLRLHVYEVNVVMLLFDLRVSSMINSCHSLRHFGISVCSIEYCSNRGICTRPVNLNRLRKSLETVCI